MLFEQKNKILLIFIEKTTKYPLTAQNKAKYFQNYYGV